MRGLAIVAALALAVAVLLGGTAPFGRVLLAAGLPGAAGLFEAPDWQGVALYRAGDWDAAAARFKAADDPYNLGLAEVRRGDYAAALEAFDLAQARGHPQAQANFDVVAAYYAGLGLDPGAVFLFEKREEGPQVESFVARGDGRASGTGTEATNTNTMMGLADLLSTGEQRVRRIFDDRFMVADDRWLEQLADVPGAFMEARIAEEHKRRRKLGLTPPEPEDPR